MQITIPSKIYDQIQFFVDKSTIECSGLGKVITTPQGYEVTEVTLLEQENTATHTEINAAAVCKAMYELRNSPGGVYFWWHSHVNMDVFWSGTDKATIEEIGQNGLCVAVVFNKKREKRGAVWLKGHALSPDLYFSDIPVTIDYGTVAEEVKAAWAKEFDEKCKAKTYAIRDFGGRFTGEQGHFPLREAKDFFDIIAFEKELAPLDYVSLQSASNSLMYAFSTDQVDKELKEILEIVKRSKASKHDKKKAYKEYKEMAIEQKNYLAEREEAWGISSAN
jgi:hypothetical protein